MKCCWPLALCLLCWLTILLAPPMRQMFLRQVFGTEISSRYYKAGYGGLAYGPFWIGKEESDFVLQNQKNDLRVLAVELETKAGMYGKIEKPRPFFKEYDRLIARYPDQSWLLARRLLHTIRWMEHDRLGGELDDAYAAQHKTLGEASPEHKKTRPNFTRLELNQALNVARRGQKLEPDNAFFDWMEVYLLFASWQDKAAWPVLKRASYKPRFDKHDRAWLEALIFRAEAQSGRPLLIEEALTLRAEVDFSWLGKNRYMARIITWERIKASRRGEHQKALDMSGDLARLMFKASRQSYWSVDMSSLSSLGHMILRRDDNAPPKKITWSFENDPHGNEKFYKTKAQYFAEYANQHGRRALADEVMSASIKSGRLIDVWRRVSDSNSLYYGAQPRPFILSIALWWAAGMLLLLWATLLFLWLVLIALLRWAQVPLITIQKRDRIKTMSAAVFIAVVCLSLGLWMGVGWQTTFYISSNGMLEEPWSALSLLIFCFSLVQTISFTDWFCDRLARRQQEESKGTEIEVGKIHQRLFKKWRRKLRETRWMPWSAGIALDITAGVSALWWIFLLTGIVYTIPIPADPLFHLWSAQSFTLMQLHPLWPLLAFTAVIIVRWMRFLLIATTEEKPRIAYQLRLLQQTFGALLIVGSVGYCLLLVLSVPLRVHADAEVQKLIERGEVASMLQNWKS